MLEAAHAVTAAGLVAGLMTIIACGRGERR